MKLLQRYNLMKTLAKKHKYDYKSFDFNNPFVFPTNFN